MTQDAFPELLALGTGPELNLNAKETFVDAFLKLVEKIPDATAVVDEYGSITYGELNRRSDNFAAAFVESGVEVGDVVAINLPRVKEFLVAVIGIWKAGAAYLPIDPSYPDERIRYMLKDSGARLVIDREWMDTALAACPKEPAVDICRAEAEGTALLMYTSGSTGVPKGVVIPHVAILAMSRAGNVFHRPWAGIGYRMADMSSFSYVYSCQNIYMALMGGWELHLLPTRMTADIAELDRYLRKYRIDIVNTIPQMAVTLMNSYHTPLDIIGMGGAKMAIPEHGKTRVLTGYGSTETSGAVAYMMVPDKYNGRFVLGRPSAGTVVVLEDKDGTPVPLGEVGEICISSPCLASGYLHDEARTNEVFVDRPWSQYKVLRTGDLGKWNEDGVLEFCGRKDDVIKIDGNRVELGEIDVSLSRIKGIKGAASTVKVINGQSVLCGYYVSEAEISETSLRSSLAEFLPSYMIPSRLVRLASIPRLPNGKLDRLSLPMPELSVPKDMVAPTTEFEKRVFEIVSGELGIHDFGVTTNLLSLGLTSLRAIRLSCMIKRELDLCVSLSTMLARPTVREWECASMPESDGITIEAPRGFYPLTDNQTGVYVEWERNRESDQYNNPFRLRINGGDAGKLWDSVKKAIEIHPVLKTHLAERDGRIVQLRRDDADFNVGFEKLDSEPDDEFFRRMIRPFNLLGDDLSRFSVYSSPDAAWLFFDVHHIIFDGCSLSLFLKTLSSLYRGVTPESASVTAYDYALYREHWKETDEFRACGQYFEELLDGTESFAYPSLSGNRADEGRGTEVLSLPRTTILPFCRKCGITENSFFATVLTQVFHRVSREENVQIAMFSSGRSMTQIADTIGMFVRTLPLVSRATDGTVFEALKSIHSQVVATLSRDQFPYAVLAEKHGVKPNVMYAYQGDLIEKPNFGTDAVELNRLPVSCAISPLSIEIVPWQDQYTIRFEYDRGLYGADEMKVLAKSFANMARGMSESKIDTLLRDVEMVDAQERLELIRLGTGDKLDYDRSKTFVDLFRGQVEKTPDAVAVADADSQITYRELDEQSDALARWLIEENGVKPDDFVVVELPRVKEFVVAVIGIWKAGAAYVPVDPGYPEERKRFMIEDSQSKVMIDEAFLKKTSHFSLLTSHLARPSGLAYMIYTSGSTGKPKGAVIAHSALTNFVHSIVDILRLTASDRISCSRSFSFDAHIEDIFPVLTVGGSSHIMPEGIKLELDLIRRFLFDHHITGGSHATQKGMLLFQTYDDLPVRFATVGGESMSSMHGCHVPIINMYGLTECTVDSSYHVIEPGEHSGSVSIGRPMPNSVIFIIDRQGKLMPCGAAGELCVAGPQIAKGYWHRPELTAEKFVDCPYLHGQKMYKTGDLARWNENGELEFRGRIDNQVKLRGFRIELGEIESVALKLDGVKQAVAVAKDDRLALYYTGEEIAENNFVAHYSQLPDFMVPSAFVHLDEMPLTPNGKINRNALISQVGDEVITAPETERERLLFGIVADELGTDRFGVTTNLMSVGLTSIRAIKLSIAISQRLGIHISTADILANPRIRDWDVVDGDIIKTAGAIEFYPITDNQLGIFIDWEKNRDGLQYNVPLVLKFADVAAKAVVASVEKAIAAHPSLKTCLVTIDGRIMQRRRDNARIEVRCQRLEFVPSAEFFQCRVRPFDLLEDDLARFEVYYTDASAYLFIDVHHIIFDGGSANVLLSDIAKSISGEVVETESVTSFDYALHCEAWKRSGEYRECERYFDELVSGTVSFRYPESGVGASSGKSSATSVQVPLDAIRKRCRMIGVTENTYFATVLTQVLHGMSREDAVQIVTFSNGRSQKQLAGVTGMFVQTLPLVSRKRGGTVSAMLHEMQKQFAETIRHDKYPFTALVEKHGLKPNVMYVFQGDVMDPGLFRDRLNAEVLPLKLNTAKAPLCIGVAPGEDRYSINVEYDTGLYSEDDMEKLARAIADFAIAMAGQAEDAEIPDVDNGKIESVAVPEKAAAPDEHVAPATEREWIVLERAKSLLGIDDLGVTDDLRRLGLNSIKAMKLASGLPAEWGVKVADIIGIGTIRGMLAEKRDVVWFHERYDPAKRTVAIVHGVIGTGAHSELKDELAKSFNVLVIENIHDTLLSGNYLDDLVSPDGYNEFIRLYARRMRETIPADGTLALLIGFSMGGLMAYDTACEWERLTGQKPVVVMGDSYLYLSTDAVDGIVRSAPYEKWRADIRRVRNRADAWDQIGFWDELRRAIYVNKRSIVNYRGRVILLRALHGHKIGDDIAIKLKGGRWYRLARWFYRHLHIKDFLASKRASRIGVLEFGHRKDSRDNYSAWKRYKSDMEMLDFDATHSGLFCDRELLPHQIQIILTEMNAFRD